MKEMLWNHLATLDIEDFFITANVEREGKTLPEHIDSFIAVKLEGIRKGSIRTRKFVFKDKDWRVVLTFFPTYEVVEERYALKNKLMKD